MLLWDNKRVKILVLTPHYYPEAFSITSICESWAKQGHDVFVVTDKPNYGFNGIPKEYKHVKDEVINGVRVHRCALYPRKKSKVSLILNYLSFYVTSCAYMLSLKEEFDVVYSFSLSPVIASSGANKYKRKHHVQHVLHCLDLWPESVISTKAMKKQSLGYKILLHWSKSIYSKADEVLVSSPSFEEYFRDVLKLDKVKISYVPQPPFLVTQEGEDIVYSDKNNFLYVGNIGKLQLVENLVEAFGLLNEGEAHLTLIGAGSRSEEVKTLIKQKHLENRVSYLGPKPRKEASCYFLNCDCVIVSLKDEGHVGKTIPSKLISSLDYGKPILACIGGDGKKVLEECLGAVFSSSESPEDLARAIRSFLALSEEEKRKLGENNRAYYKDHFEFDSCLALITSKLETHRKI